MTVAGAIERRYRERSLWLDGLPESLIPRRPLAESAECDVAIIGAGFTGLWTAYYLARTAPALRIIVLEREIAGFGASGRNGGWVSAGIAGSARAYGIPPDGELIRRATRETHASVDEIGRVVVEEQIDCGFRKAGVLEVATTPPQRTRLLSQLAAAERAGAETELIDPEPLARIPGVLAASFTPQGARVNPGRLVRGLAHACETRGVTIHEGTEARSIAPGRVSFPGGTLGARTILRATESYTTQLPGERLRYLPLYSLMVATDPLPKSVWDELGWRDGLLIGDLHHLFFYAQRTEDGRIAIGGRGAPYRLRKPIGEHHERSQSVVERLRATIRRHFPAAGDARVTHHWGGPLAVPRDWAMSVSFDAHVGIGFAGGYSGHGVVASNIAGRTLADLVLGAATERTGMPWVNHRCRRWEPEPLRFLASSAVVGLLGHADRYEDRTGRSARRVRLIRPFLP